MTNLIKLNQFSIVILILLFNLGFCLHSMAQETKLDPSVFQLIKTDHTSTDWYQEIQSANPNVLLAEKLFNDYFQLHYKESSKQKKLFTRWLQSARLSMDANGFYIQNSVIPQKGQSETNTKEKSTGTWRMTGPNFAERTACGTSSSLSGGFCDRVYINPNNTNNLFAGFSYGGLWVSQDQGKSWNLTDGEYSNGTNTYANRDYYYGEIEASATNSTIIYAATEAGLLKSLTGGADWSMCPDLNRTNAPNLRPYYIALSTSDSDRILSTFGRNVFLSIDGGDSWQMAFDNENGGNNHYYTSQYSNNSTYGIYDRNFNFFGLEADHNDPNTFYLGVWNDNNEPCIYRSINGGVSFNFLINLNTSLGRTLPSNLIFQTIPAQPDRFYIYPQFSSGDSLYRFHETGTLLSKNQVGTNYMEAGDINWLDESSVYAGFYFASSVMQSSDGAISFTDQTDGYAGCPKYVHPDVRGIDAVGDIVLIGSDGGIALSTDGMNTVSSDIGREISSIDLWGFSSSPKSDIIAAGCDHGPTKIRRFDGDNGWISRGGGDAGQVSVNQSNDRWIYYNHGYGIFKTELSHDNEFRFTEPINPGVSLNRIEFHPNLYQIAYGINGTQVRISRDNFNSFELFYDFSETVNVIKIAQRDTSIIYTQLSNNKILRSTDGGSSWTIVTPPTSVTGGQTTIVDITLGDSPMELWAAYGNWQNNGKVIKSTDGGDNWSNISSSNLPLTPISQLVYQRGTQGGVYIAMAGQSGVWYRNNSMNQWEPLGEGLVSMGYIRNIYSVPAMGKFRMGSSRGSWEHDLYEESDAPIASFSANTNTSNCPISPIAFIQNCSHSSGVATYNWTFSGGYPSYSNEENPLVRYNTPGQYDVSLEVIDENGNSNVETLTNFITVTSACEDSDFDGINDLDENTGCTNFLAERIEISGTVDSVFIVNFDGNNEGQYYLNLDIQTPCNNASAFIEAFIDLNNQEINVIAYQHFGSQEINNQIIGSGTETVRSLSNETAQFQLRLDNNELFLFQLSNDCPTNDTLQVNSLCWANIDPDNDGLLNHLDIDSDNDGLMDLIENTPCYTTIPATDLIMDNDAVLISDFENRNTGIYFLELDFITDCDNKSAKLKTYIDLDNQEINISSYQHFGSNNDQDEMSGNGTSVVISSSSAFAQIKLELVNSELSVQQVSSTCNGNSQLVNSCLGSLDEDDDGILNYLDLDSDNDGLTDSTEAIVCDQTVGVSDWFSAGDSVLVADFFGYVSTVNLYYMDLNAFTNCYNLNANMKVFINLEEQKINVLSYQHFGSINTKDPVLGDGSNIITAQGTSFATIRYKLIGDRIYLHQVSNACGSVLRRNNSCWNKLDICAIDIPDYLNSNNTSIEDNICFGDSYTFPDETVQENITEPAVNISVLESSTNCDSIVITSLSINEVNITVSQDGAILTSDADSATYQWINCENGNMEIEGETNQIFSPTVNGEYAVIVTENGCSETSDCYPITLVKVVENTFGHTIGLYPNPANEIIYLNMNEPYRNIEIEIISLDGRSIVEYTYIDQMSFNIGISELASGEYYLRVSSKNRRAVLKFIKS